MHIKNHKFEQWNTKLFPLKSFLQMILKHCISFTLKVIDERLQLTPFSLSTLHCYFHSRNFKIHTLIFQIIETVTVFIFKFHLLVIIYFYDLNKVFLKIILLPFLFNFERVNTPNRKFLCLMFPWNTQRFRQMCWDKVTSQTPQVLRKILKSPRDI